MSKIITNPLDEEISVVFNGVSYNVEAKKSLSVSDEVATFIKRIYGFVIVADKETPQVKEEVVAEEEKEKPKKSKKAKK